MPDFTIPGSYEQVTADIARNEKRRKLMEAMQARNLQQSNPNQMVGDRVVQYSPIQGLTQLAQALINKKGIEKSDTRADELAGQQSEMRSGATQDVLNTIMGSKAQPEVRGPLDEELGGYEYTPAQPEVQADPMRGAIQAMTEPALKGSGMDKIALAMMKAKGGGERSPYFSLQHVTQGDKTVPMVLDHRTGKLSPMQDGMTSPRFDPSVKKSLAKAGAAGKVVGETQATAEVELPSSEVRTGVTLDFIDDLVSHPGMKDVVGVPDNPLAMGGLIPGTDAAGFRSLLDQITGRTFMEIYPTLKGGGQITEIEGEKGQSAVNRMKTATSEKDFISAANDFKSEVKRLHELQKEKAGQAEPLDEEEAYQRYKEEQIRMGK